MISQYELLMYTNKARIFSDQDFEIPLQEFVRLNTWFLEGDQEQTINYTQERKNVAVISDLMPNQKRDPCQKQACDIQHCFVGK